MNIAVRVKRRLLRPFTEKRVCGTEFGESINIDALIAPLRYDILIRVRFAEQFQKDWLTYQKDLCAFLDSSSAREYYCWFKDVRMAIYRPKIARDDKRVRPLFIKQVHRFAKLWQSIETRGYQSKHPIRLLSGHKIVGVNGKSLAAKVFVGDGCHRIACLYLQGHRTLTPTDYEVVVVKELHPIDSTWVLRRKLPIPDTDYLQFLARGYCGDKKISSIEELCDCVARENPKWSAELGSVLQADLIN